jgi:hypothetical protein
MVFGKKKNAIEEIKYTQVEWFQKTSLMNYCSV